MTIVHFSRGLPCHEFEPSTTKDQPCRAAMHVKSVESGNVLPLRQEKTSYNNSQISHHQTITVEEEITKRRKENILMEEEIQVIESRFITKEEAQSVCPERMTYICKRRGCHNAEQENFVRQKLHKMRADDTCGLPYELILVLNRPYMITDVADGLLNDTAGKLCFVEMKIRT
ncbi:uncharacterized protein TNCV_4946821 [Trichonephila clavipes]|nr:uncharacterized protein TNCV_4946821 [Trichonephila clavipes]